MLSFRVSALAAVAVLGLAEFAPVLAQPQAPVRPRYSSFGNIFSPNRQPGIVGGGFGQNQPFINPIGPQVAGFGGPVGFVMPGQAIPQVLPGAYGTVDPTIRPTGVVGTFNNLGHWYGGGYGHWYPNGIANGRGITGYGGGGGGGSAFATAPTNAVGGRTGGSLLGTGMAAGATVNQLRR